MSSPIESGEEDTRSGDKDEQSIHGDEESRDGGAKNGEEMADNPHDGGRGPHAATTAERVNAGNGPRQSGSNGLSTSQVVDGNRYDRYGSFSDGSELRMTSKRKWWYIGAKFMAPRCSISRGFVLAGMVRSPMYAVQTAFIAPLYLELGASPSLLSYGSALSVLLTLLLTSFIGTLCDTTPYRREIAFWGNVLGPTFGVLTAAFAFSDFRLYISAITMALTFAAYELTLVSVYTYLTDAVPKPLLMRLSARTVAYSNVSQIVVILLGVAATGVTDSLTVLRWYIILACLYWGIGAAISTRHLPPRPPARRLTGSSWVPDRMHSRDFFGGDWSDVIDVHASPVRNRRKQSKQESEVSSTDTSAQGDVPSQSDVCPVGDDLDHVLSLEDAVGLDSDKGRRGRRWFGLRRGRMSLMDQEHAEGGDSPRVCVRTDFFPPVRDVIRATVRDFRLVFSELKVFQDALRVCYSYACLNASAAAIITNLGSFFVAVTGADASESGVVVVEIVLVGAVGALVAIRLGRTIGVKWAALISICSLLCGIGIIYFFVTSQESRRLFYVAGVFLGFGSGALTAAYRALFGQLIPRASEGQFFGIFFFFGKSVAWSGPLLFGLVNDLRGIQLAMGLTSVFLIPSMIWLLRVHPARGQRLAEQYDAASMEASHAERAEAERAEAEGAQEMPAQTTV